MGRVTHEDKVGIIPKKVHINQWWDDDANEHKDAINDNDSRITALESGSVKEAPIDGLTYGRQNEQWVEVQTGGLSDAPSDGNEYVRKNGAWSINTGGGSSDGNDYVDSVTLPSGVLTLGRTGTLPDLTVDLDARYYTESEVNMLWSSKADSVHSHDDRYYTETEIDSMMSGISTPTLQQVTEQGNTTDQQIIGGSLIKSVGTLEKYAQLDGDGVVTAAQSTTNLITLHSGLHAIEDWQGGSYTTRLSFPNPKGSDKIITLPDKTGTVALLSDISTPSNMVTIDTNQTITGTKTFSGTVTASSFARSSGTNDEIMMGDGSTISKADDVVTNSLDTWTTTFPVKEIVTLTQIEYDAIGTPSDTIMYVIIPANNNP